MANHVLSLEVPTVTNTCVMKIFDTSVYQTSSPNIPIVCPTLTITVPGFSTSVELIGNRMEEVLAVTLRKNYISKNCFT